MTPERIAELQVIGKALRASKVQGIVSIRYAPKADKRQRGDEFGCVLWAVYGKQFPDHTYGTDLFYERVAAHLSVSVRSVVAAENATFELYHSDPRFRLQRVQDWLDNPTDLNARLTQKEGT